MDVLFKKSFNIFGAPVWFTFELFQTMNTIYTVKVIKISFISNGNFFHYLLSCGSN